MRNRKPRFRNPLRSENTLAGSAEERKFVHAWCSAVQRLTRHQLQDRGHRLTEVWHERINDSNQVESDVTFEDLTQGNYPPLLTSLARKHRPRRVPGPTPLDRRMDWLGATLGLDNVECAIIAVLARSSVHEEWHELLRALPGRGIGPSAQRIALVTGLPVPRLEARLAPGSRLWLSGLLENGGEGEVSATELLANVARFQSGPAGLPRLLMPASRKSSLAWEDFDHLGPQREIAERLVAGGKGVSILFYGPPGTGKTEFARLLATRVGARAVFAGLTDESGREPSRNDRIGHLAILRALTRADPTRIVVMDEADDILLLGGGKARGGRSKLWLNRLIEETERPTIWIVNEPAMLEESIIRRMSVALEFPRPPLAVRRRIVTRQAKKERLRLSEVEVARLAAMPAAPALLASAIKGAREAGGGAAEALAIGEGLVTAIRGAPPRPFALPAAYDPSLALADCDLAAVADKLVKAPERGWSLLLSGPSGTGKSAYARHLAERLGIELIEKRGSDLLNMYVGGTEARIARAFARAGQAGAMLLIDEADDFLFDRRDAKQSWERSQVNEMLRQMESLRAPFVATTNLADKLDPATQRRFTLHATFRALDPPRAAVLFARWFGMPLPPGVALHGQNPGDFANVSRRAALLGEGDPAELVRWLRTEGEARGEGRAVMGFAA